MDRASTQQLLELFDREEAIKTALADAEKRVQDTECKLQQEINNLEKQRHLVACALATIESSRQVSPSVWMLFES